jgi:CorA-like Mg2+ transporter protein
MDERADPGNEALSAGVSGQPVMVRHFRHMVLWPLQIMSAKRNGDIERHDHVMQTIAPSGMWTLVEDEIGSDSELQERHYREFVTFLPHVQRFLYGEGGGRVGQLGHAAAPLRTYRRSDITKVRLWLSATAAPVICNVVHLDLIYLYDVDAAILACELAADELPLHTAEDIVYRFGRAYPPGWEATGEALHCPHLVEWLDSEGQVVGRSDYQDRQRYLAYVNERRAPCIAAHWEQLLRPLVPDASEREGALRFRQIEYYRMPCMTYLAMDDIGCLTRADTVRLALASAPGASDELPFSEAYLTRFEETYCYDRFRTAGKHSGADARFLSCGHALTIVAGGSLPSIVDENRGLLGEFRHQYFLLFLLVHIHKAAFLMLSDRLVAAIKPLEVRSRRSIRAFRRDIYGLQEAFLRFSQRYYVGDVSDKAQARELYRMLHEQLGIERLYQEIRSELFDVQQYLDSDLLRRQSGSMLRLTVVTIIGLVGAISTGFLGMNLIDEPDAPLATKLIYFGMVSMGAIILVLLTIMLSRPLASFFDWLSRETRR